MLRLALLGGLALTSAAVAAPPLPEPLSYAKPTPGGRFVLVVFGSRDAEASLNEGANKRHAEAVRAKYPVPGMYGAGDDAKLVYPLDGYAPDENVFLSGDGRHVIRLEGDSWRTKAYPAGKRLPSEVEQAQLDAPAVSFFEDGRLLRSHPLKAVVPDPAQLPHSPDHILWVGGAVMREDTGRFVLFTQDSHRVTFDFRTGEVVAVEKTGFGNPFGQTLILVTLGLSLLLLLAWGFYAFRRRRPAEPHSASPPPGPPLG